MYVATVWVKIVPVGKPAYEKQFGSYFPTKTEARHWARLEVHNSTHGGHYTVMPAPKEMPGSDSAEGVFYSTDPGRPVAKWEKVN